MKSSQQNAALAAAVHAARAAGTLMRQNLHNVKKVNEESLHDIKLELDVRCQKLIERLLHKKYPEIALLGEEGESGAAGAEHRWVVDPIDGTVNFAHSIPHACVSIALQERVTEQRGKKKNESTHVTLIGVVYDPFTDELWTAIRGEPARLNGKPIRVSKHDRIGEAVVSMGFSKSKATLERSLPFLCYLARNARKVRIMGSAALALTYVATGRFDAYFERRISLWDIAAGGLILECAGGSFQTTPLPGYHRYSMVASNGPIGKQLVRKM
jgi:myo-inositol-1(or 4)-monophosphatase